MISIPGPLRSFARMAALSPDLSPDDLLGGLARNVVTNGYQASASSDSLDQTEYLKLVFRYMSQAREFEKLATDTNNEIKIETCDLRRRPIFSRCSGIVCAADAARKSSSKRSTPRAHSSRSTRASRLHS